MNTIYWITRLDAMVVCEWILSVIFAVIAIIGFIVWLDNISFGNQDKEKCAGKILVKLFAPLTIIMMLSGILTPTTEQAIVIYGGGKILEYVDNNPKLKQMPDKVVELTDKYIDKLDKELSESNNNQNH